MSELLEQLLDTRQAADPLARMYGQWVMDRASYDQIRAACLTEEQERARASAHQNLMVSLTAPFPRNCPACCMGAYATMDDLTSHVLAMADPDNRDPDTADCLFGIPIDVRDDGGEPHIEAPPWATLPPRA